MANRVLLGEHDSLGYGMYVSKPGEDVTSATKDDLIFNSNSISSSLLHQIVDVTISSGNSSGTGTITGLAYVPFINFTEYDTNGVRGLRFVHDQAGTGEGMQMMGNGGGSEFTSINFSHWQAYTTNTTITISTWATGQYNDNGQLTIPDDVTGTTVSSTKYFRCFVYRIPAV